MRLLRHLRSRLPSYRLQRLTGSAVRTCRHCDHARFAHRHHRKGTDCCLCYCIRFRR